MVDKKIINNIKKFVKKIEKNKIRIVKVILYGSRASDKSHQDSDIDIAIVSPDFGKNRFKEGTKLFEIACDIDPRLEPVPISLTSFENDTWLPLIYEIRENGIELKIGK